MFEAMHIPHYAPWLLFKVSVTLSILILALCLAFCFHQWKTMRAYSHFPSYRLDTEWMLRIVFKIYPKDVPFTSFVFQKLLNVVNAFRKDGLCVLWLLKPVVCIFDEELMKDLLYKAEIADKAVPYHINSAFFGNGLVTSKFEVWKVHRKLMNPAFNVAVLKSKTHNFNYYAHEIVEKLQTRVDKPVDDLWTILKYASAFCMADFILGLTCRTESRMAIAEKFLETLDIGTQQFVERITRPWLYWDFLLPFFKSGRNILKVLKVIDDELVPQIIEELNKQTPEEVQKKSQITDTCVDIALRLHLRESYFTKRDVRDHILTFTSAGSDTVTVTTQWCFYTLGHHPHEQEKAYQEVMSIAPEGDITYSNLAEMKYLECVIKETLRMYSTIPIIGRKASQDIQCGKYTIPKGTNVMFFLQVMHRDPKIFPEPNKFDPGRFCDSSKLRPWMYIPFSEGYRNCIGKKLAMMEMKIQLAHVLRQFKITSISEVEDKDLDWTIVLKPSNPLRFLFQNRCSSSQACEI